jgi:hypothetical protein
VALVLPVSALLVLTIAPARTVHAQIEREPSGPILQFPIHIDDGIVHQRG